MIAVTPPKIVHLTSEPHRSVVEERGPEGREERLDARAVDPRRYQAAGDAEDDGEDVEQRRDRDQREEARDDEVLDRVDAEHLQRVELLADLARAEVGGDRGAGGAGDDDRADEGRELAHDGEHEEAAHAVERAEEREEVGRLQARHRVGDAGHRDHEREEADASAREMHCVDQLVAVGDTAGGPRRRVVLPVRITRSPTSSNGSRRRGAICERRGGPVAAALVAGARAVAAISLLLSERT